MYLLDDSLLHKVVSRQRLLLKLGPLRAADSRACPFLVSCLINRAHGPYSGEHPWSVFFLKAPRLSLTGVDDIARMSLSIKRIH